MEVCAQDLKKIMEKENQLENSKESLIKIVYNILCCMNFLHSANIMHRDLKPSNFLITETHHIKICDFGLSRANLSSYNLSQRDSNSQISSKMSSFSAVQKHAIN